MLRYAAGRIVLTVPVLFGVSLMSFAIIHLIPGDIVSVLAGPTVALDLPPAQNIRRALLDWPLPVQYGIWLGGALQRRFRQLAGDGPAGRPAIASHLPVTLVLTAVSLIFAIVIGLPGGVAAATARGRWPDIAIRGSGCWACRRRLLRRRRRGVAALDLSAFVQDPWRRRPISRSARRASDPVAAGLVLSPLPPRRSCATRAPLCWRC